MPLYSVDRICRQYARNDTTESRGSVDDRKQVSGECCAHASCGRVGRNVKDGSEHADKHKEPLEERNLSSH
jgi:hypothetical protein